MNDAPAEQLGESSPGYRRLAGLGRQLRGASPFAGDIVPSRIPVLAAGRGRATLPFPHPWNYHDPIRVLESCFHGADAIEGSGRHSRYLDVPGLTPFLSQLHAAGFTKRGGRLICTYFDENFLNMAPAEHVEGLYGCLDYYQQVEDPFSVQLLARYNKRFPGAAKFTGGSACSGLYRGIALWAAAVTEAGTLERGAVVRALDHARIAQGPGGGAEMVPGQHHLKLNMYIAQARSGHFKVVKNLGVIEPNERLVEAGNDR